MAVSEITIGLLVGGLLFVVYLLYRSVIKVLSYYDNYICPDMNDVIIHKLSLCRNQWPIVFLQDHVQAMQATKSFSKLQSQPYSGHTTVKGVS